MKKCFYTSTLVLLVAFLLGLPAMAQGIVTPETVVETSKRGQTGFKFLSASVDARAASLGGAVTAQLNGNSSAMFYNPASMAMMESDFHATLGQMQFIVDINYNIASLAYRPSGGNYGVFGFSLISVDYGEFIGTVRSDNEAGFEEFGTFSPSALAIGVGYARTFTDRFAAGANIKYALQDLGSFPVSRSESGSLDFDSFDINTIAFDFGLVYATGFRSLVIGMSARNFSQELTYVRENFELPLTFQIGVAMDLMDFTSMNPDMHSLHLNVDAQRPRDFDEHVRLGLEYTFMSIFSLRGGFEQLTVSEEQGASLGAGVHFNAGNFVIGGDYTYTDFGLFDSVNRFALQIGF